MSSWSEFEAAAPELAQHVRERLDAHTHKTIATLRRDGSPRISGTESRFAHGELWVGSMWQALKARDLRRDPRYALHSGSDDPPGWSGDAKVSGVVQEVTDPELVRELNGAAAEGGPSHLFRLEVHEASCVTLAPSGKEIVIDIWTAGRGVRTIRRA
jgi:Pyridoxamine 5'-phosphate oxidase